MTHGRVMAGQPRQPRRQSKFAIPNMKIGDRRIGVTRPELSPADSALDSRPF